MDYQVEELSPVKKKVNVQVPAEEINAAIGTTIALFRKDLKLSGFRKGKVPSSIVENRFKKDIYEQAGKDLLNVHFNQIFNELGLEPISGLEVDAKQLERDKDFNYSFSFEVRPEIYLPEYNGLNVTKKKVKVQDEMVDKMVARLQREHSSLVLVEEERYPQDGDVAVINFQAYKNGQPLENIQAENFELTLGEGSALNDFEDMVKQLKPGQSTEGEIAFPDDFINAELAGQTVNMKVSLNVIKERKFPEVDEELAKKLTGDNSVENMRETLADRLRNYLEQMEKSVTQKKLLDMLVSTVHVDLPESLVDAQLERMVQDKRQKLEQQGKNPDSVKNEDNLREELRPEAEGLVKSHLVLLDIAKKEEISVSNQEVEQHILQLAINSGQDPEALKKYYEDNNMMFAIRDSLLADKAMELVYENANVEEVDSDQEEKETQETSQAS